MSSAAGELGFNNSTAATSDHIIYPWAPAGNDWDGFSTDFLMAPEKKPDPKRKSKWLLKQMARRGHKTV